MKNILSFLCGGGLILLFHAQAIAGPLDLDWSPSDSTGNLPCTQSVCFPGDPRGSSPGFRYDIFLVNGVKYAEIKVGDENSDFVQQSFVRIGGAGASPSGLPVQLNDIGSHSGGVPGGDGNQPQCATIAPGSSSVCVLDQGGGDGGNQGLGFDPLGLFTEAAGGRITVDDSGSGTNNPTTTIVRMVVKDSEFEQEFLKDGFNYKPEITATLTTPDLVSYVNLYMSAIDYNTLNANAPFVNTLTFTNPVETYGNFNQATDAQNSNVTAGQFVYLPQGGWISGTVSSSRIDFRAGLYLYPDGGGFNVYDNDVYGFYWDPDQNGGAIAPPACATTDTCVLPAFATD